MYREIKENLILVVLEEIFKSKENLVLKEKINLLNKYNFFEKLLSDKEKDYINKFKKLLKQKILIECRNRNFIKMKIRKNIKTKKWETYYFMDYKGEMVLMRAYQKIHA